MSIGTAVFIDTSIAIARTVHGPATKRRIQARLSQYDIIATSEVVRQEFKRRLLKEAQYLLNQFDRRGSYAAVMRHVIDVLPPQQNRKRTICLEILQTIHESANDSELTERARRYLRSLLRFALTDLEECTDHLVRESGCGCASQAIIEKTPYKRYEFGTDRCSRVAVCHIARFLALNRDNISRVLLHLRNLPDSKKSDEIKTAESFLTTVLESPEESRVLDPCLSVGDALIALESAGFPAFYTLNGTESQHFCRALNQTLVVRPKNPDHDDRCWSREDGIWPEL